LFAERRVNPSASLSFKNAFTPEEIKELADKVGLTQYGVYLHGPCRLALVVNKQSARVP
jgi:hypothetical protein